MDGTGFNPAGWPALFSRRLRLYGPGLRPDLPDEGVAPSLYLRKGFQATPDQAASTNALVLASSTTTACCLSHGREAHAPTVDQPITSFRQPTSLQCQLHYNVVQFTLGPASTCWSRQQYLTSRPTTRATSTTNCRSRSPPTRRLRSSGSTPSAIDRHTPVASSATGPRRHLRCLSAGLNPRAAS